MNSFMVLVKKKCFTAFDSAKEKFGFMTIIDILILWLQVVLSLFRIRISESIFTNFGVTVLAKFDSAYYVDSVLNFAKFNYCTPYSLIKNRAYMWFLLLCHFLKINPHVGVAILHVIAAFLIYRVSIYLCKNRLCSLFFFVFVLFHPIAFYFMGEINLYRNTMYVPLVYFYLTLLIILANRIYLSKNDVINWIISIMLGMILIITFFMSETGITHLLIYSFLSVVFTISIMLKTGKFDITKLKKAIFIFFTPLLILECGIVSYKFINYRVYGVYDINMRTEGEIGKFIENLQDIESDSQNSTIWCSIDQIDKAYSVSQTFKEHKNLYDSIRSGEGASAYIQGKGYAGDFLGWGITQGLLKNMIDYVEAKKIFKAINRELNDAFKSGLLKRTKKIKINKTLGRYTVDEMKEIRDLSFNTVIKFIEFKDYNLLTNIFASQGNFGEEFDRYYEYYNVDREYEPVNYHEFVAEITNYYALYQKILLCLFFTALILVIVINVRNFRDNLSNIKKYIFSDYNFYMLYAVGFFVLYYLYILVISMFLIWLKKQYNSVEWIQLQLEYNYTSIAYVFLTLCFIFSVASVVSMLKTLFATIRFDKIHIDVNKRSFSLYFIIVSLIIILSMNTLYKRIDGLKDGIKLLHIISDVNEKERDKRDRKEKPYKEIDKLYVEN